MAVAPQMPSQRSPQQPGVMQQTTDPLADLRDIHPPGMIETWPPAPGWWILAFAALLLLAAGIAWLVRRWQANRYRREAMRELETLQNRWRASGDEKAYLEALQRLLKRVALTRFPRQDVASLTGEAWVQFLDRSTGSHDFSMGTGEVLIDGNYRNDVYIDVDALHNVASQWIARHDEKHLRSEGA